MFINYNLITKLFEMFTEVLVCLLYMSQGEFAYLYCQYLPLLFSF